MGADLSKTGCYMAPEHGGAKFSSPPPEEHSLGGKVTAKLFNAAACGDVQTVRRLLDRGLAANTTNYDQRTALHVAASEGMLEVVELLLSYQADPNATDRWGHSVLDESLENGSSETIAALRRAGASTPSSSVEGSAMQLLESGSMGQVMLSSKSFAEHEETQEAMLVCCAAAAGSIVILEALHNAGKDLNKPDYDGRTALHVSAAHGHLEVVGWLLDMHANPNVSDRFGLTPLVQAMRVGHTDVADLLVKRGSQAVESSMIADMRLSADIGVWKIASREVEFGDVLAKTLKSVIYRAKWRGLPVVAKTCGFVTRSESGENLVEMDTEDTAMRDSASRDSAVKEAVHEIKLLSTMRHPDLVMFLGACFDHKTPFCITEFMEGGDLERYYMGQAQRLGHPFMPPAATLMKWSSSVARALSFLHGCAFPIIHRDLKPLNLLLGKCQDLKVADFGISKLMSPKRFLQSGELQGIKAAPLMSGGVGTWRYMAPEVVRYEQYTDRVDVYSFALILWFMNTGRQPFVKQFGPDAELVLKEYIRGGEPRPEISACRAPQAFKELMQDCWKSAPTDRPSSYECTQRLAVLCTSSQSGPQSSVKERMSAGFRRLTTPGLERLNSPQH